MKSSTVFGAFLCAFLLWIQFPVSESAECSFLTQTQCGQTAGCVWNSYCTCASNVTMDVVFALDTSGSIGSTAFQSALSWLETTIETALPTNTHIGLIKFSTNAYMILNFSQSATMTTQQIVDDVANIYYDAGWTYTVGALDETMKMFHLQGRSNAAYVLIIITDGDPCCTPYVKSVDICSRASSLKAMGITTIIIGVGSGWNPANVDCLVKNDSYLIPVQSYNKNLFQTQIEPKLTPITCPVSYKMILTEVKVQSASSISGSRFVEAYNTGPTVRLSDLTVSGVFAGTLTSSTSLSLLQTRYLVLYDGDAPNLPSCQDCKCTKSSNLCTASTYIKCCKSGCTCTYDSSKTNVAWTQTFTDHVRSSQIETLTYDTSTWPHITLGYSYELKYVGYDNKKGSNWQQSCNAYGTPGDAPINNCSQTCVVSQCTINGNLGASCNGNKCSCTSNYYFDGRTCAVIPPPGACYTYWMKNATNGVRYWRFVWDPAPTDVNHKYALYYFTSHGIDEVITTSRAKRIDDYASGRKFNQVTGTVYTIINNTQSIGINCTSLSMAPTPSPTYHPPVVYISGDICKADRCNCSGKGLYNCTGEPIQKAVAADNAKHQFITIARYPDVYSSMVFISWNILFYGDYQKPSSSSKSFREKRTDMEIIEEARQYFEAQGFENFTPHQSSRDGRTLLTTFTSTTTTSPTNGTLAVTGISPTQGLLNISASAASNKISLMIYKATPGPGQSKYRLYLLNLTSCNETSHQVCTPIYPAQLYMVVDVTGGEETITNTKTEKKMPTWLWGLIAALLAIAAVLAFLGYRYWWKHKQTSAELHETNAELDAAHEENELGFGRDLAQGDVHFNPIATGVPNTTVAPQLNTDGARAGLMANDGKADVAVEKFNHREEFGQRMPDKRSARPAPPPPSNF